MKNEKENEPETKHLCNECALFMKRGCANMFPFRVKPTEKACGSFIDPVSADKKICNGWWQKQETNPQESIVECPIRFRCARFIRRFTLKGTINAVETEKCANHGYPDFIKQQ